jgi:predicted ATPase/class 3 adenylate cyclase
MVGLPRGTVTLLFTDIEASTRLLQELGRESYIHALEEHRRLLREAFAAHGGVEVEMQGDSFHFAFARAGEAVVAAAAAQRALAEHEWEAKRVRVRIGIHTGEPVLSDGLYAGLDVHRAARIMSAGHGGQVLLSQTTRDLLEDGFELCDLGEQRLKDLLAPVRIYQLGTGEFPPLRTLRQTNLPVPATPFLGRRRELAELGAQLVRLDVRLLTLTGPGGVGKTRLALQAAAEAAEQYPDGIYWVPLAALRDPTLVLPTIAQTLDAKQALDARLADKRLLLVLDNLEQLVEAAPELAQLLTAHSRLNLLLTSREPLHLTAEHAYPVPPLQERDAVALFHERARAVGGDVSGNGEIAEICRRLDQLPLAIELAAARANALSPPALLKRLQQRLPLLTGGPRDVPERQRTLKATIDWSYHLLAPAEQRTFARLSVFAGGCTLELAEQICDTTLDTLHSLIDKGLLRHSHDRYWMLETIREYANEALADAGEADAIRQRHADAMLALAQAAEPGLETGSTETASWLSRLEREHDNLRTALVYLEATAQTDAQLDLIGRTRRFWLVRGHWAEGLRWAENALAKSTGQRTTRRGLALHAAASLAASIGEQRGRLYAAESLAIARDLGDIERINWALQALAICYLRDGEYARAERLLDEAVVAARQTDHPAALASANGNLADLAMRRRDYETAIDLTNEALAVFRELGAADLLGWGLCNLAQCLMHVGRIEEAVALTAESLAMSHAVGDLEQLSWELNLAAALLHGQGYDVAGARLIGVADELCARIGLPRSGDEAEVYDQTVTQLRRALGQEQYEAAAAEGQAMPLDDAVALASQTLLSH